MNIFFTIASVAALIAVLLFPFFLFRNPIKIHRNRHLLLTNDGTDIDETIKTVITDDFNYKG